MDVPAQLDTLAKQYFQHQMAADPFEASMLGVPGYDRAVPDPSRSADQARIAELRTLSESLRQLDDRALDDSDRVTYSMLRRLLDDDLATLTAGASEVSVSGSIAGTLSGIIGVVPAVTLASADSARDYLARLEKLGEFFDGVLERHRMAADDGRFPTALGVRQAVEQADGYLGLELDSDPLLRADPPPDVDAHRWRDDARRIIDTVVRPAVRRYRNGLAGELLPVGRDDEHVGIGYVPGGTDGYLAAVGRHTTTDLTPEQVHQLGLDLVSGLREEFAERGGQVLGSSDVPEVLHRLREDPALRFGQADEIVTTVTDALRRAENALPDWFPAYDIAPCQVTEMNPVEAKGSVLGYYMPPAANGSRPGTHCVNTYEPRIRPRFEYETLAFHESVPGHHLQFGVSQRLTGLPDFRRFGYVTVHSEGWGLYTERLADQMGLYTSDLSRLGMVSFDAWRACRLVVDTGMHHLGWSRTRAVTYMRENTALSYSNIDNEVDRYIANPGQALAYMMGRQRIEQLRGEARTALGPRFDIKRFHDRVLGSGAVPLDTLDDIVRRWIAEAAQ